MNWHLPSSNFAKEAFQANQAEYSFPLIFTVNVTALKHLFKYLRRKSIDSEICEKSQRFPINTHWSKAKNGLQLQAAVALLICAWCIWLAVLVYLWWFPLVFMPLTNCNSCPRCFEKAMFITENDYNWLIYTSTKYHGKHLNNWAVVQTTATW